MKRVLIFTVFVLFYSFIIAQTSVVDYTIIGNESNEYASDLDTLNGFVYLSGNTNECGNTNGFILKYKSDSIYERVLIGDYNVDVIKSIESRSDGKLFLAGYTDQNSDYDILLAKLDTQLTIVSEQILEIENWNFCYDIAINNNALLGVGKTHNGSEYDAFVFKVDDNLDTVWTTSILSPNHQQLNKIIQYNDSIYIAAGYSEINGVGKEIYLVSLNANTGDTLWTKTIGGVNDDFCSSIIKSRDDGIVGFGTTSSYVSTSEDYMLFKTDSAGNFIWSELHQVQNGIGTYNDRGIDLIELQNGDLVVASYTESYGGPGVKSTMIMFTNSLGHWLNGYIYDDGQDDIPTAMVRVDDTTFYIAGIANSQSFGYSDAYLMRMRNVNINNTQNTLFKPIQKSCYSDVQNYIEEENKLEIYPNPIVSNGFYISNMVSEMSQVGIYNSLGEKLFMIDNVAEDSYISIPEYVKNGNYIIKITSSKNQVCKKVVVLR